MKAENKIDNIVMFHLCWFAGGCGGRMGQAKQTHQSDFHLFMMDALTLHPSDSKIMRYKWD